LGDEAEEEFSENGFLADDAFGKLGLEAGVERGDFAQDGDVGGVGFGGGGRLVGTWREVEGRR
jgi:hypothetical protein